MNAPSSRRCGVLLAPAGAVAAGDQAMGFCELTGALCCTGSVVLAAGRGKGGGPGKTAAPLAPVPLLMWLKGIPLCEGLRCGAARAGGQMMLAAAVPKSCRREPGAGSGTASIGTRKGTAVVWEIKSGRAELQPNFSTMSSLNTGLVSRET